jgi:hypothetical protein
MLKLEEHILELSKNQRIATACSPTDERMGNYYLNLFYSFF